MEKISRLEANIDQQFTNDTLYGIVNVFNENLSEMSRIGRLPNSQLEVHIEGGEGFIPHMHICRKTGRNIVLRLEITRNVYFREKDDRMNSLSSSERKALNNFMNEKIPYRNTNRWDQIVDIWNQFNPEHMIDPNKVTQPDYTEISEPRRNIKQ